MQDKVPGKTGQKAQRNYRNFIYNKERGFIFAYVPKVACTNWKSIMRYLAGHADYLNSRLAHDKVNGGLNYLDLTGPDLALLSDPGIRKYTFIRNPYSRTLSSYLNKVAGRLDLSNPDPQDHWAMVAQNIDQFRQSKAETDGNTDISFETFLLWLRDSKSHFRNDEHWQQQSILLQWPTVEFDFIGRFESLNEDAKYLLSEMGCDVPFPTQADVKFASTGANEKLAQYLTPACRQLVEEVFAADFANFGYAKGAAAA